MVGKADDELKINGFSENMEQNITRSIAADYLKYRLQRKGFEWENDGRHGSVSPSAYQNAMRTLGDEFEERFRPRFDDLINDLIVTDENANETFTAIVNEIFSDGINWGRIVALFGFSGRFAIRCYELNKPELVDNLLEWLTTYVDSNDNLRVWMDNHNNWEGFLAFQSGSEYKSDRQWPSFKTFLCAAAGIGIALSAFLSQKS